MNFTIRQAGKKDIPSLRTLFIELTGHELTDADVADRLEMIEKSPIDELYVCEQEKRILGVLGFRIRENIEEPGRYGEISVIVTDPKNRMHGVGRSLMEFAERRSEELGCIGTWLVSGFGREEAAHKFYAKLRYTVTGYRFVKRF